MRRNNKKNRVFLLLLILLGVSIGFAALATTLKINGSTTINKNTWNIYWDNIANQSGVTPTSIDIDDEDENNKDNIVTFSVTLDKPGDYFEFTVDAVNAGTIDAEVLSIDKKYNGTTIPEVEDPEHRVVPAYLKYEVKYADGTEISVGNKLPKAPDLTSTPKVLTVKTVKVRVEYDRNAVTNSDINNQSGTVSHSFSFSVQYGQATAPAEDEFAYTFFSGTGYDLSYYGEGLHLGYAVGVGDVLALEYATTGPAATNRWNGGPTDDYNNLRLEYTTYHYANYPEYVYNSVEECNYEQGTDECVAYQNVDIHPKTFKKIYYDSDRVITKIDTMFIYNNTLYDLNDLSGDELGQELVSIFGEYDSVNNTGCKSVQYYEHKCISPDKTTLLFANDEAIKVYVRDSATGVVIANNYHDDWDASIYGPTNLQDEWWENRLEQDNPY